MNFHKTKVEDLIDMSKICEVQISNATKRSLFNDSYKFVDFPTSDSSYIRLKYRPYDDNIEILMEDPDGRFPILIYHANVQTINYVINSFSNILKELEADIAEKEKEENSEKENIR